jgi:hypothetical protein
MMQNKVVSRTAAGQSAWESTNSGLPTPYRRLLDVLATPTPVASLARALPDYSGKQISDWLDQLETLCFICDASIGELSDSARDAA